MNPLNAKGMKYLMENIDENSLILLLIIICTIQCYLLLFFFVHGQIIHLTTAFKLTHTLLDFIHN